jgi:uncharacterized protein YndB with AHSA1/START domain
VLSPRLSSYWLRLVTAVPTPIARALIEGLRHDFLADDAELRALVPLRLHTFREAVLATFEAEQRHAVASRWTEGAFVFRDYRRDYSYYAKRVSSSTTTPATPADVWRVVAAIGGERRYYFANWLWALREWVDWAVGGPGRNRGRRDPDEVRVGDTIDSWRVIGVDVPRRLTLCSGMKAPGAGVLEFELEPAAGGGTRLTVTTYWHPAGVWGLLFWHMLMPVHLFTLRGLTRQVRRRAEPAAGTEP